MTHMRARSVWPGGIAPSASPEPPVTVPIITTRWVPPGQRLARSRARKTTVAIVVPRSPAHVVVLTWVRRLMTVVPEPPVAERGVHPPIVARRSRTPRCNAGAAETNLVHRADDTAAAGAANGTAIREHPAIEIATRA